MPTYNIYYTSQLQRQSTVWTLLDQVARHRRNYQLHQRLAGPGGLLRPGCECVWGTVAGFRAWSQDHGTHQGRALPSGSEPEWTGTNRKEQIMKTDKQSASFLVTAGRSLIGRGCRAIPHAPTRLGGSFALLLLLALAGNVRAQVNSGSDGHDGAFNPTTSTVINMADHPDGIYQYTEVNIPTNMTVTFMPNANNTPVVWLVQSNCVINGTVDVSGQSANGEGGSAGGPGGFRGGNGGSSATPGQGPGGGSLTGTGEDTGGNASFGSIGGRINNGNYEQAAPGALYGNTFLLPLLGGSGGGGCSAGGAGAGGGGTILIAASQLIQIDGSIVGSGGSSYGGWLGQYGGSGGAGSGGGIRLVTRTLQGRGQIKCAGGTCHNWDLTLPSGGSGRIRLDYLESLFGGALDGTVSQGFQPIIIPAAGQGIQLAIASVGGVAVAANPSGVLVTPDAIIAGQQANPIAIVVHCSNLPLNTPITVTVRPANGSSVSALGYNNTGTQASSTATVPLNMPRGGGILYATAATGN